MANVELDVININTQPAEQGVTNVKSRIKELKQSMVELELQGKSNTKEFQQMKDELGNLTRAMKRVGQDAAEASTTFSNNFANATRVIAGASAAVQTVTGMMGLFGKEVDNDSKLMKTLVSAMAVTSGVTAIQSGVDAMKLLTRSIKASTAAQKALNAATKANPWMLLASAVVAAGTALYGFIRHSQKAEEQQRRLRAENERVIQTFIDLESYMNSFDAEVAMNKNTKVLKAVGDELQRIQKMVNKEYGNIEGAFQREAEAAAKAGDKAKESLIIQAQAMNSVKKAEQQLAIERNYAYEDQKTKAEKIKAAEDALTEAKQYQIRVYQKYNPQKQYTSPKIKVEVDSEKYDEYTKRRLQAELDYVNLITDEIEYNKILLKIEQDRALDNTQMDTEKKIDEQAVTVAKLTQNIKELEETKKKADKETEIKIFDDNSETQRLQRLKQLTEETSSEINKITEKYAEERQLAELKIEEETAKKKYEIDNQDIENKIATLRMRMEAGLFKGEESEYYKQMADMELRQTELAQEYADKRVEIAKNEAEAKLAIQERYKEGLKSITGSVTSILGSVAEFMDKESDEYKFTKAAEATISTLAGSIDAYMGIIKSIPGPLGIAAGAAAAAAVLTQGMATVKQIYAVDKDKNNSSVSPAALVSLSGSYSNVRLQNGNGGQYDLSNLEQKIGNQKVYVVQADIDSAHDRRVKVRQNSIF